MLDPPHRHAEAVHDSEQEAQGEGRPGDHFGAVEARVEVAERGIARRHRRQGGDGHEEEQLQPGPLPPREGAGRPGQHVPNVAPEIGEHGEQGSRLDGDADHRALLRPAEEGCCGHPVAGRADRQECRDPLHDREDHDVEERHEFGSAKEGIGAASGG